MGFSRQDFQSSEDDSTDLIAEINITPLTDIFLVLLIIFMVTSSMMSQMGVSVHLPQATEALAHAQPEGVVIELLGGSKSGQVRIQETECDLKKQHRFEELLKTAFLRTSSRLVILEGDRQAFLGRAIEVMERARQAGATKFAIATAIQKNKN